MIKVKTRSGSVYKIDLENGLWMKYYHEEPYYSAPLSIKEIMVGEKLISPYVDPDVWTVGELAEGLHLFISSHDEWWVSTKIVSIEHLTADQAVW